MHRIVLVGQEHRHQETARVMGRSADKSVGDLRQASEENRAKLASTVNELRGRMGETASELKTMVSPAHIKQEIRNYVPQERESLIQAVRRKVRDNPLQAAAVGAAIAYPALGLLRSIPMPLWLIGAGLFLTSERGQQTTAPVKSNLDRTVQNGTEVLSEAAGALQSRLSDRVEQARANLSEVGKSAATAAESLTNQARAAFHDARDALEKSSTDVTVKLADVGHQLGDVGNERTESLKNSTSQAVARSQNALETLVHDYPLIIAGLSTLVETCDPLQVAYRRLTSSAQIFRKQARRQRKFQSEIESD